MFGGSLIRIGGRGGEAGAVSVDLLIQREPTTTAVGIGGQREPSATAVGIGEDNSEMDDGRASSVEYGSPESLVRIQVQQSPRIS